MSPSWSFYLVNLGCAWGGWCHLSLTFPWPRGLSHPKNVNTQVLPVFGVEPVEPQDHFGWKRPWRAASPTIMLGMRISRRASIAEISWSCSWNHPFWLTWGIILVYPRGDANRMLDVFLLACMAKKECSLDYLIFVFSTLFGLITVVSSNLLVSDSFPSFSFLSAWLWNKRWAMDTCTVGYGSHCWLSGFVSFWNKISQNKTEANQKICSSKYGFPFLSVQQIFFFNQKVTKNHLNGLCHYSEWEWLFK